MTAIVLTCDVCNGESGGKFVGVGSLTTGPISVAFCDRCLQAGAEPTFALDYLFIHVASGDLTALNEGVFGLSTWADGRYIPFKEYVERISADDVKRQLREYAEAMGAQPGVHDGDSDASS